MQIKPSQTELKPCGCALGGSSMRKHSKELNLLIYDAIQRLPEMIVMDLCVYLWQQPKKPGKSVSPDSDNKLQLLIKTFH